MRLRSSANLATPSTCLNQQRRLASVVLYIRTVIGFRSELTVTNLSLPLVQTPFPKQRNKSLYEGHIGLYVSLCTCVSGLLSGRNPLVKFEVLTAVPIRSTIFSDMTPCNQDEFTDALPPSSGPKKLHIPSTGRVTLSGLHGVLSNSHGIVTF
jgi:hypothetical protein